MLQNNPKKLATCIDKSAGAVAGMEIKNLDVHFEIPMSEINEARKAMRPQTARRGKVQSGPSNNGNTLQDLRLKRQSDLPLVCSTLV